VSDRILFSEWLPDQPVFLNEGLTVADGCFAIKNGYAPVGSFEPSANGGLPSQSYGGAAYRTNGETYSFGATLTSLYRYTTAGYTELAGGLSNALGLKFSPYSTLMLVTNGSDPVKKFTPAPSNAVTDLGGFPPVARYIAVVGGFVVLGYASGSPSRVAWCNQGNPEQWTPSVSSEAGVFDMATGGDITGVVGGEYGLIFQENRIVRMSYTASDTIWQFDEIATDVGCIMPGSIATWGRMTFFLSNRGFMVCDGSTVTPVADEKVSRWYMNQIDRVYAVNTTAIIDPRNSLYVITIPSAFPSASLLLYNYSLGKWSTAKISTERLIPGLSQEYTLESLDALYGSLDAMTESLDSATFRGGYPLLLLYDSQHRLGALSGAPVDATFSDAVREFASGKRTRLRSVRPITDAQTPQVTVSGMNSFSGSPTPTNYTVMRGNGTFSVRENWNLTQITVAIPSQRWSYAQGYDFEAVPGGRA
jgi:hypothetical protein